jgi:hypothetical protein
MPAQRRLERVLAPAYLSDLAALDVAALHAKKAECVELETEYSFVRRLAQGRIDIIEAEQRRRSTGGSMDDFIANLSKVLADDGPRPNQSHGRLAQQLTPSPDIRWTRGMEHLVGDATLARLPDLSDEELDEALSQLKELETEVSATRRQLHDVLRVLEHELAERIQAAHP